MRVYCVIYFFLPCSSCEKTNKASARQVGDEYLLFLQEIFEPFCLLDGNDNNNNEYKPKTI